MGDPGQAVAPLEGLLRSEAKAISARLVAFADRVGGAAVAVTAEQQALVDELAAMRVQLRAEQEARETAERMQERFRYALFVYLQERDGPAGTRAPTPETLALIRTLIGDADGS